MRGILSRTALSALVAVAVASCALNFSKDPVDRPDTSTETDTDAQDTHSDSDTSEEPVEDFDVPMDDDADSGDDPGLDDLDLPLDPDADDPVPDDTLVDDTPLDDTPTNPYSPLTYQDLDLRATVEAFPIPSLSTALVAPTSTRRSQWTTFLGYVLDSNWAFVYAWGVLTLNLNIVVVHDVGTAQSTGRDYLLIWDPAGGEGIYVLDLDPTRPLILEVPYPVDDSGTLAQGIEVLRDTQGWGLLIAGTTRCSRSDSLICDGTTMACDAVLSAFRVSDVAHNPNLIFQLVHRIMMVDDATALAVQLQGQVDASGAIAILSDGTTFDASSVPPGISVMLRSALQSSFPAWSSSIRSCNAIGDSGTYTSTCHLTNAQGRYTNGSSNLCSDDASTSSQRFVVLEQDPLILDESRFPLFATAVIALF